MLDGVEIRTVSGPVINEISVICPKKMYSVSSCMGGGIYRKDVVHVTVLPQTITNSLRTDSVIMKPRCVSSSSSGSLESIA